MYAVVHEKKYINLLLMIGYEQNDFTWIVLQMWLYWILCSCYDAKCWYYDAKCYDDSSLFYVNVGLAVQNGNLKDASSFIIK